MHGDTMMLVHTEVPPQLERRGFASMLVRAAFDYAKQNGLDVLPVCSFVARGHGGIRKSKRCSLASRNQASCSRKECFEHAYPFTACRARSRRLRSSRSSSTVTLDC